MTAPRFTGIRRPATAILAFVVAAFLAGFRATAASSPRPNLVVILCDDLGYGDLSCFGNTRIKTPNLDRMAAEGMKFTDFHVGASVCSPSRAALLTGRYPVRTGVTRVLYPHDDIGLSNRLPTLSSVLKRAGYATAAIGKWHVGHRPGFLPLDHGFDHYFGIPYSNDMGADPRMRTAPGVTLRVPEPKPGETAAEKVQRERDYPGSPLMRDDAVIEHPVDQSMLTRRYTDEALRFIASVRGQPFFLYLAHTMPHVPLAVSPSFRGRSAAGLYGDAVEEIDFGVGEILAALRALGLAENTLVVFTSDNGPWLAKKERAGTAGPLRDGKFSQFEGGHREPTLAWWPGRVPADRTCTEFATTLDLLPTFCGIAGIPAPRDLDGKDIRPLLFGRNGAKSPHRVFYHAANALRQGSWKYVATKDGEQLFDLATDTGEHHNLALENPGRVTSMRRLLVDWNARNGITNVPPILAR